MASLATLHHVTHVSSAHHPSLHSADHSMISNHIGGSGHTMTIQPIASHPHPMPTHPTSLPYHPIPIRPTTHNDSGSHHSLMSNPPSTHSIGVEHKSGDVNLHLNDKGYSIGGKDCFGGAHDTICVGGNYSNTWGSHSHGGGMATISWSHQW